YPGLRQVQPGELLVWEPGRLRAQRYWQLRFPDGRDVRQTVAKEAVRRAREQLEDAVRIRTSGVVPALLLSGGLGAASVRALPSEIERRRAGAITVAGAEPQAAALARKTGAAHERVMREVDWVAAADRSLAAHAAPIGAMDEPLLQGAVDQLGTR